MNWTAFLGAASACAPVWYGCRCHDDYDRCRARAAPDAPAWVDRLAGRDATKAGLDLDARLRVSANATAFWVVRPRAFFP